MTKAWRIVLFITGGLVLAGLVLAGVGWLTGASPLRMADILYGGVDGVRAAAQTAWETVLARLSGAWQTLLAFFG